MATCPAGHESSATDFCDVCGMRIGGSAPPPGGGFQLETTFPPAGGEAPPSGPAKVCPNCGAEQTGRFCETCGLNFSTGVSGAGDGGGAVLPATGPVPAVVQGAAGAAEVPAAPESGVAGGVAAGSGLTAAGSGAATGSVAATGGAAAAGGAEAAGTVGAAGAVPNWTAVVTADRDYYDSVVAAGGPDAGSIEFPSYCPPRLFRLTGPEMRIGRRSASRGIEPEIDLSGPPIDPGVSHLHAVLMAEADGSWTLMDPGSANGTQLNGTEIAAGERVPLHSGDRICLGGWTALTIQAG
jgi:hypothetical protein